MCHNPNGLNPRSIDGKIIELNYTLKLAWVIHAAVFGKTSNKANINKWGLKDPSQARLCYCFDLKFAIKLLVERDKTSQQFNW